MAASQLVSRASISSQFPREPTPLALSPSRSLRFPSLARTKSFASGSIASRFPRTANASTSAPATVGFLHCCSKDEDGFLCCEGGGVQDVIETVERICLSRAWMEDLPG